ncbi:MAG: type I restriction endonuclease [Candidatus Riflebacteria bacterium]
MLEKIRKTVEQVLERIPAVKGKGEEATKQALIYPILEALGYNIWLPTEVCPEYEADFAIKKNGQKEKVDIAVLSADIPRIFIEIKSVDSALDGHEGQLARYFNAIPSVTLGILTNGIEWRFFTDTITQNVMDGQPFHVARFDSADPGLEVLPKFSRAQFSAETIKDYATELLYTAKIADFLKLEIDLKDKLPSEYMIRWVLKSPGMYDGVVNTNTIERFKNITKSAFTRVIRGIVRRSVYALDEEAAKAEETTQQEPEAIIEEALEDVNNQNPNIITTEKELKLFDDIKAFFVQAGFEAREIFDAAKRKNVPVTIGYKDTTAYFGIFLNKPSWWAVRAYIESKRPWIGFNVPAEIGVNLVQNKEKILPGNAYASFRIAIDSIADIHFLKDLVIEAFNHTIQERNSASANEIGG